MKTSSGVEIVQYISPNKQKQEITVSKEPEEVKEKETIVMNIPAGMSREAAELYNDLEKWSFKSLKAKFVERIETHLRSNPINRDQMLSELDKLDAVFKV